MSQRPHVLFLFLDGVGIGWKDPETNPFFAGSYPSIEDAFGGSMPHLRDSRRTSPLGSLVPISATLGIPGLPQSGTGQTSLLTGVNAARMIGKHFGPFPYSTLRPVLAERNLFRVLHDNGRKVFYANAFPRRFFEHVALRPNRVSAMTMSWMLSGFPLNDPKALIEGRALSADLTGERFPHDGASPVPVISPGEAGERLSRLALEFDFVLFEYYLTDHAGHSRSMEEARGVLAKLDKFLGGIMRHLDPASTIFIITSDHGNLEDLSTKSHTRNPVPFSVIGRTLPAKNLTHVYRAILDVLI